MRSSKRKIAVAFMILVSSLAWSQTPQVEINKPSYLVRMSFAKTWRAHSSPTCFSADVNGHYQIRRSKATQYTVEKDGHQFIYRNLRTELLQGTLDENAMKQLKALLENPELVSLTPKANFLRKDGETFAADVAREHDVQRVVVTDSDYESAFPPSVRKLVSWLENFKAEGAEPLDDSDADICPSPTLQLVNPAVAMLQSPR
jgi:hypothetical protein